MIKQCLRDWASKPRGMPISLIWDILNSLGAFSHTMTALRSPLITNGFSIGKTWQFRNTIRSWKNFISLLKRLFHLQILKWLISHNSKSGGTHSARVQLTFTTHTDRFPKTHLNSSKITKKNCKVFILIVRLYQFTLQSYSYKFALHLQ